MKITFPIRHFNSGCMGIFTCCLIFLFSCTSQEPISINVIPKPVQLELTGGYFTYPLTLSFPEGDERITIQIDSTIFSNKEAYDLEITSKRMFLKAATPAAVFYAFQTIQQLQTPKGYPCVKIVDYPRFQYRGLHLDVSRHFFDKKEVEKLLDVMSYYKLNRLHLHLTDAGGWRFVVDSYPKLTTDVAYRTQSDWQKWWGDKDRKFLPEGTKGAYGGYYTKEDLKEMVAYAAERQITIIPEIEFPGHSEEVLVAYPELSCSGKPYTNGEFCIGNPETFTFMEKVLTEVMDIFPSQYIHIGGDEAGKKSWKRCPKCQALMRKEGMKQVDELQSYMIHKAEEFLNSKGRKLIGWDEILQGGLAPDATVMSWRGESGGIQSARMGHDVVMTPGGYMYFDHYQANPVTQPYAIGGYTPIKKVYSYDPVPVDSLTEEQQRHIRGVQGNTWTEYISTEEHLEYMMFPRALAVAEIGWTPQNLRSWQDFKPRMNAHIPVLQQKGIHPFTLSDELDVTMNVDTVNRQINVFLDAEKYPAEIHYTIDGTVPTQESPIYKDTIIVRDSANIKAGLFKNGQLQGVPTAKRVDYHRGINKSIHYNNKLYPGYMAGGRNALLDGYRGGLTYADGHWQGYLDHLDCVIDMGEITSLKSISSRWMQLTGPGVYQPVKVELLTSEDGENFKSQGVIPTTVSQENKELTFQEYCFTGNWKTRYIRLKAQNPKGFIFVDEIVIW